MASQRTIGLLYNCWESLVDDRINAENIENLEERALRLTQLDTWLNLWLTQIEPLVSIIQHLLFLIVLSEKS